MKKEIQKILWRLAFFFRWKNEKYANWFLEELHDKTKKVISKIDIDTSKIKIISKP